jgi:class 3 adenylate cyclase
MASMRPFHSTRDEGTVGGGDANDQPTLDQGALRGVAMPAINDQRLEQRLGALEAARSWSPRVVSRLETLIRAAEDDAVFRINPIKFAGERNIAEGEAVDLFLHASAVGLFTMDWMVLCPMCSAIVESFGTLRAISANHYHCPFCQNDYEAMLDDYIVIVFTIAPSIRRIAFHEPDTLPPFVYLQNVCFSGPHLLCEVPQGAACLSPRQVFEECLRGCDGLAPGAVSRFDFVAGGSGVETHINGTEVLSGTHFFVPVSGAPTAARQHLHAEFTTGGWRLSARALAPGPVELELRNSTDRRLFVTAAEFAESVPHCCVTLEFEPHLSAKRLLTTQTFRNLFRSELIKGTEGIGVRDITLLFTDLKGSTALYERIGDLNAFSLVQQHFEKLTDVTVRHNGAIIKTLGDAIMAAFVTPAEAVAAALAMREETVLFNEAQPERDLILKVGLHRGAAIAVTLNDRLDYFGQSVNIAARVEALADGGEICLTREVHDAPEVARVLEPYPVTIAPERLKGVQETIPVWRVRAAV